MNLPGFSVFGANMEGLMRSVKAGRIVHAFLLTGPAGTGKRTAAGYLAQALLCTGDDPPCGKCPECRQFAMGSHPDAHYVRPEERSISVDDIRALRDKLALRPFEGGRQTVIIEQADRMTDQAQNALLKTLEEPMGDTGFFLIADQVGSILPTIVSRCCRLRFAPLSVGDCAKALGERGLAPDAALRCARAAQGRVGRALEISADEGYFPLREKIVDSLRALSGGRAAVAGAAARAAVEKERTSDALEMMEAAARDLMAAQNGGEPFGDVSGLKLDGRALLMGVLELRRMLASNVSWQGALEKTYLGLAE